MIFSIYKKFNSIGFSKTGSRCQWSGNLRKHKSLHRGRDRTFSHCLWLSSEQILESSEQTGEQHQLISGNSWNWIFTSQFYPYPNYGTFTIMGESFDLMDGIFGLALSPRKSADNSNNVVFGTFNKRQNERSLYFHSLASGSENFVPLRIVNNSTLWEAGSENTVPREFSTIGTRGIQTAGEIELTVELNPCNESNRP